MKLTAKTVMHQATIHPALFLRGTGYTTYAPHVLQVSKTIGKQYSPATISLCHFFKLLTQDLLSSATSLSLPSVLIIHLLLALSCLVELISFFHSGDLSSPAQHGPLFIFSCGFDCLLLHLPVCSFVQFQSTLLWSILLLRIQVTILLKIQLFFLVPCLPNIEHSYFGDCCSNPGTENAYAYSCFNQTDFIGCSPNLIWVGPAAAFTQ